MTRQDYRLIAGVLAEAGKFSNEFGAGAEPMRLKIAAGLAACLKEDNANFQSMTFYHAASGVTHETRRGKGASPRYRGGNSPRPPLLKGVST